MLRCSVRWLIRGPRKAQVKTAGKNQGTPALNCRLLRIGAICRHLRPITKRKGIPACPVLQAIN